jgi:CRISPR system Cascade subunit CasD
MPDVLALRLSAPLQSWGGHSRHTTRSTLTHPTKSGVVGLCAAALGVARGSEKLSELAELGFGVRIDQAGTLLVDFHTISAASHSPLNPKEQRLPTSGGGRLKAGEGKVSRRAYLQSAVFVAVLEADSHQVELLDRVEEALRRPRYPLYLGRRSCPPDRRVLLDRYRDADMFQALKEIPWQGRGTAPGKLPIVLDDPKGEELLPDLPLPSPAFRRAFADRPVLHDSVPTPGFSVEPEAETAPVSGSPFSGDASMDLLEEGGL